MSDHSSRPGSPVPRSRAMSPQRPELIARPSSRCESLLRDTLRRDEHERSLSYRTASRSPNRWAGRRSRPRGNSFLEALRRDDSPDSGCEFEDNVFIRPKAEGENSSRYSRAQAMAMRGRGAISASSTEAGSLPYGSPTSPSPMPPSMPRTHTSPAVPRAKGLSCDDERRGAFTRTPSSPYSGRRSLPNTVTQSHVSNDSSPKQHYNTLSPHESVLRAKLNYVLQQAGPVSADESAALSQRTGHPRRNHQRAFSHGVTVVTSPKHIPSSTSPSPQSLAPSSLSNSATDLVRVECTRPHRQDSLAERASPSSPSEPLTPPPTPPFNARTAAEACKRMNGYVSFANVEGLGEPPGLDIDQDNNEDGLGTLKRWLRLLPLAFGNGGQGPPERAAGRLSVSRQRSNSTSSG
ncbi:uncharacterized protein FOMMEDRAFT_20115 [Fomitiporia mediterranea MF3/22]|uniref:uncharacterized protein n=1 Tax=Fomitiporia mediterranea (strain MF3/22) TaxID=694068 RepID=UPI0004407E46|nr:uncharacterized protein FOMMEDRAFT_20115 [Fomitiporia mediterranea MF3/22]EJD02911.1 hypothetical protein FOMMEDRAFT_20115 [Fomitiporia mediterranea MF3/22]